MSKKLQKNNWWVDFDSTMAQLDEALIIALNGRFDLGLDMKHAKDWSWLDKFTREQCEFIWGKECFNSYEWTMALPPVPHAVESLKELQKMGVKPYLISDRRTHMKPWLEEWLANQGLENIPVFVTSKEGYTKADASRDLSINVVVEDAPHHAENALTFYPDRHRTIYLLDKLYNRGVSSSEGLVRVDSWLDIVEREKAIELRTNR